MTSSFNEHEYPLAPQEHDYPVPSLSSGSLQAALRLTLVGRHLCSAVWIFLGANESVAGARIAGREADTKFALGRGCRCFLELGGGAGRRGGEGVEVPVWGGTRTVQ